MLPMQEERILFSLDIRVIQRRRIIPRWWWWWGVFWFRGGATWQIKI